MCNVYYVCKRDPWQQQNQTLIQFHNGNHKFCWSTVSLNGMRWCRGGMFVWAGEGMLAGGGCKVTICVDTWSQKAVIQKHQLLCGITVNVSAVVWSVSHKKRTCVSSSSLSGTAMAPHIMSRYVFRLHYKSVCDRAFKHLLTKWTPVTEYGWAVMSIICQWD